MLHALLCLLVYIVCFCLAPRFTFAVSVLAGIAGILFLLLIIRQM